MKIIRKFIRDIQVINLTEARRNPDMNPKISAYEALKPYSKDDRYFISFTQLDKLGINPKSRYETPLGIYTYPLSTIWKEYRVEQTRSVGEAVPFAGDNPYIWLVKVNPGARFIKDMYSDYGSDYYDRDMRVLKNHFLDNLKDYELKADESEKKKFEILIDRLILKWTQSSSHRNPIMGMWNVTRNLAMMRKGKPAVQWNFLLRKVLGYDGFADRSGRGFIHPSEPIQAVFMSTRAFKVVAEFLNKDYDDTEKNIPDWFQDASIKNAEFQFDPFGLLHWKKGTWIFGDWKGGKWIKGLWKDGTWEKGEWFNGTFEKGKWMNGIWRGGTFVRGTWMNGIWMKGEWKGGLWIKGYIYDPERKGNFEPGWAWRGELVLSTISPKEYFEKKRK